MSFDKALKRKVVLSKPGRIKYLSGRVKRTRFFYKNFGSAPSTKSFLISHENFAIIVLKVS